MPFVLNSRVKKVAAISTGMADLDFVNDYSIQMAAPYAISKAALNLAVAKFNARYKRDGVLFLSISPGFVATGQDEDGEQPPPPKERKEKKKRKRRKMQKDSVREPFLTRVF